ncbi:MAG: PAS domain S-box protein [Acidobacteriota bacterium]|nr:PAS domain S-box protein [Acidobacteriota bacterium]
MGQLFDVTQDLLCVIGFDGRIKFLNDSWEHVLGYTRPELMATPLREKIHPEDRDATVADIEKVRAGVPTKSFENRIRCKGGSYRWFSWSGTASEAQRCFYVSGRDITETKESQASVLRLAQALEHSAEMICMSDGEGRAVFANQALLDVSGYQKEDIVGKSLTETLLSGANQPTVAQDIHEALKRDGKWTGECFQRRKNGPDIPVSLSLGLIKDRTGRPTGAYGISYDITERKRAELELKERTAFLNSLIKNSPVGIVAVDVDHRVKLCNPTFEKIFGYREQDIIGRPLYELLATPAMRADVDTRRLSFQEGEVNHILAKRVRSDGSFVDVEGYAMGLGTPDRPAGAVVLYQDITQRKFIERQLQLSERNYRSFVDDAPYAICRITLSGQFLQVNQAMLETLKYDFSDDLLQKNLPSIFAVPECFDDFRGALLDAGAIQGFESIWRQNDGGEIQVRVSGRAVRDEYREVQYLDVVAEDVTERKHLEEQLRQAQKMQAIGQLAGGVAHDFNNLLTIISGQAEVVLLRDLDKDTKLRLEEMKRAANRAARLTGQLLAFSRRQVMQNKVLGLNRVIGDVSRMLVRLIGAHIELTFIPGEGLGRVSADPHKIEHVLMNLAVNARDAMPRGGRLTIETTEVKMTDGSSSEIGAFAPGRYVLIKVIDTGHGMDQATLSRIFEPFFTTKKIGEGTGLGLAMVYGIVEQSGGHIKVESAVGRGSTFKIYLPCVDEAESDLPAPVSVLSPGGTESILLVEDNESVRELVAAHLQNLGYRVLTACDGSVALNVMDVHSSDVDLLLSDIMMPNMGGRELAGELRKRCPALKVVFVSGYAGDDSAQQDLGFPDAAFLAKPFSMEALARTVRHALDGTSITQSAI